MQIAPTAYTMPSGAPVTLRSGGPEDGAALSTYWQRSCQETHFLLRTPEESTPPAQAAQQMAELAAHPVNFSIMALAGGEVVGDLGVGQVGAFEKLRHRASVGLSLRADFCNQGLGRAMLTLAIRQARENGFAQLELGVFSDNARAIHLYESLGFRRCGLLPRAFRLRDGSYRDEIQMVLPL